jgi:hypothetical protein
VTSCDLRYFGIDFSRNASKWGAGVTRRRSVWIAELIVTHNGRLVLDCLRAVQDLPGSDHPFERLSGYLKTSDYVAAGIDAPFSIPANYLPGGWRNLIKDIDALPAKVARFQEANHSLKSQHA